MAITKDLKADNGAEQVVFGRLLSKAAELDGARISLQTTLDYTWERDSDSTETKDGSMTRSGAAEIEMDVEFLSSDDPLIKVFKEAITKNEVIELWRVNFNQEGTSAGSHPAEYMRGYVTSFEENADADDFGTAKAEVSITGTPKDGSVTVDNAVASGIDYAFRDLAKTGTSSTGASE